MRAQRGCLTWITPQQPPTLACRSSPPRLASHSSAHVPPRLVCSACVCPAFMARPIGLTVPEKPSSSSPRPSPSSTFSPTGDTQPAHALSIRRGRPSSQELSLLRLRYADGSAAGPSANCLSPAAVTRTGATMGPSRFVTSQREMTSGFLQRPASLDACVSCAALSRSALADLWALTSTTEADPVRELARWSHIFQR